MNFKIIAKNISCLKIPKSSSIYTGGYGQSAPLYGSESMVKLLSSELPK